MKKYSICLLLFLAVSVACLSAGYMITRNKIEQEKQVVETTMETETIQEISIAESPAQEAVNPEAMHQEKEQYYLVEEAGFLLVFLKDKSTICLYTHVPIADFPMEEQEKLMEGIWFSSMLDIFNYLESYTS